jgi:type IX secretion system PorP/SprF family membrane protein
LDRATRNKKCVAFLKLKVMNLRAVLTTVYVTQFLLNASAQQYPMFTNYVINTIGFNPAIAGTVDYVDTRLTYRMQWVGVTGAPNTGIASAFGKVKGMPIGLGLNIMSDESGRLSRVGATVNASYIHRLNKNMRLHYGMTLGSYNFRLKDPVWVRDPNDLTIESAQNGIWVPDLGLGTYLQLKKGFLGISIPQIFQKKLLFNPDSVRDNPSQLIRHYYGIAGYRFNLTDKLDMEPSFLVKYTPNVDIQYEGSIRFFFDNKFWVGGSYRSEDALAAMLGVQYDKMLLAYSYDVTTSQLRRKSAGSHELTLGWRFGVKCPDKDGDGICDKEDKCPEEPGKKELQGCPPPKEPEKKKDDKDGDGILDKDDKCPDEPGPKANKGCPFTDKDGDGIRDDIDKCPDIPGSIANAGCPYNDADKDGIPDEQDKCPDIPGVPETGGCPSNSDRDKDGIPDAEDKCPDEPGVVIMNGCPENGDRDKDGIPDDKDRCPNTNGEGGKDGCPIPTDREQEILNLAIQSLYFDTDKAIVKPISFKELNRLAAVLKQKKDWKLKITGHTDMRGKPEYNLELSKKRALAIKNYLISKGVSPTILEVDYQGANAPVAVGKDKASLQLNRRAEMKFSFD